jgi:hypothetical protein
METKISNEENTNHSAKSSSSIIAVVTALTLSLFQERSGLRIALHGGDVMLCGMYVVHTYGGCGEKKRERNK